MPHRSSRHCHHQRQQTVVPHIHDTWKRLVVTSKKRVREPNANKPSCHTVAAVKTVTTSANKPSCHTPVIPLREVKNPGGERSTNVQPPSPSHGGERSINIYSPPSNLIFTLVVQSQKTQRRQTVVPHCSSHHRYRHHQR